MRVEPSKFEGDNLPVGGISWYEAMEFCARLSKATGTTYRLPSEAEWEYACRARTTTMFAFGQTITAEVVNFKGLYSYGSEQKGPNREQPTPVGALGVANGFGLYDMHGNVWEWCLDNWHTSYNGAPADGSAWVRGGDTESRVRRGGSWNEMGIQCQSAYRDRLIPGYWSGGLRVVSVAGTR
jgi:formylglycine-generating enzyme required for sulfatase activity